MKKGFTTIRSSWSRRLLLLAALCLFSLTSLLAHTVRFYAVYESNGTTTFYAATYHFEMTQPTGGIIIDGVTYNFTGFQTTLPSNAVLMHDCGWTSSVQYQTVNVAGIAAGTHSFNFTPTTAIESPYCTFPSGVFTQGSGGCQPQPVATASSNSPVCPGQTINFTGAGGVSYKWTGPNGFSSTQQNPAITNASTAATGTYTLVVTNSNGCTAASQVTVTVAGVNTSVTVSGANPICTGNSLTMNAVHAGSNTYQWSENGTPINGATGPSYTTSVAGSYKVEISNGSCSATSSAVNTTLGVTPSAVITASGPTSFCNGGSVELIANSGSGYTYQWKNNGVNVGTGSSYTATTSGSYTVTVTNVTCSATSSATNVAVSILPSVSVTPSSTTIAYGASTTLTANVASTKTYFISAADLLNVPSSCSGSGRYGSTNQGFKWMDNGSGTVTNVKIELSIGVECHSNFTHTTKLNNVAGPSYFQSPNWCSCSAPASPSIITLNFANPTYVIGGQNVFAFANSNTSFGFMSVATLNNSFARVTVTYGSGGSLAFAWTPGNAGGSSVTVSPLTTTVYTVTASDEIGCSVSASSTVNVLPPPITFSLSSSNVSCPNGNDGTITVTVSGAQTASEYSIDGGTFGSSNVFTGLPAGTYTVKIKNGSFIPAAQTITVGTTADNTAPNAIAQDVTVQLGADGNGSTTAAAVDNGSTDACGIASYDLSKSSFNCSNVGTNVVTLTVTDVNSNASTATATVTVVDAVAPSAVAQNVTVALANGSASVSAADINNGSSDACGISSLALSKTSFTCADIGTHNVVLTVTDNNGNSSSATAVVTVTGATPSCSISSSANNSGTVIGSTSTLAAANQMYLGYGAQSMNLTATATGGSSFTYSWSGSNLSSTSVANPVFTPTAAGNFSFTVTVTNNNGCVSTCSITICVLDIRSGNGKVNLCHVPQGNSNNPQTLSISVNAVPAHLGGHTGDKLGSCSQSCGYSKNDATGELFSEETSKGEVDLIVYPNPSNADFNFRIESASDELVSFRLFDISGRTIYSADNLSPKEIITVGSNLKAGIFMAEIIQGEFHKVVKITKVNN